MTGVQTCALPIFIKDGDFKIADNNLLKTHFLNVALKHNMETRKFRPIKIEQRAHIDGFVSVIDAMTVRQKYWEEDVYKRQLLHH